MYRIVVASLDHYQGRVYRVDRHLVDGKDGWVHCGLNPEVMAFPAVRDAVMKEMREQAYATKEGI